MSNAGIFTNHLLLDVKNHNQDFEWYPTTKEMIDAVGRVLIEKYDYKNFKFLDIGSGNGSVFTQLDNFFSLYSERNIGFCKYAIEKSEVLINAMPDDVILLGTDFHCQTLIDKKMDVVFCNPPYSEYEQWMEKIILESYAKDLFFVVPQRWQKHGGIMDAIKRKEYIAEVVYSGDFIESEFRAARAKVEIVHIKVKSFNHRGVDPFDVWFDDNFKINANHSSGLSSSLDSSRDGLKEKLQIVKGQNLIERLEELYLENFNDLLSNYKKLEELNSSLLKELNVDIKDLKEALRLKIENLKNLYWEELFDNMDKITDRLTKKSRDKLRSKIMSNTMVDFTADNAYAIVLWVLKNANKYIDEQLKEVYYEMASKDNISNYVSNKSFVTGCWRNSVNGHTHFKLEYRLVFSGWYCFNREPYGDYDYPNGLYKSRHDFLNDICTVAKNLGIDVMDTSYNFKWEPRKEVDFLTQDRKVFMSVRAYKNGNMHCKPSKEFIQKLNIEMARLTGWIHSKQEAMQELQMEEYEVSAAYGSNIKLLCSDIPLLA